MGIAAKLFHNPSNKENTLIFRIKPSDTQVAEQQERWNDLADFLKAELKKAFERPVSWWLQGSYKFGTQIRPANSFQEFDIDLGVYLEWKGRAEDGDIDPKELKNQVQVILEEYTSNPANEAAETTSPKTRCNRIRFSADFHIDVPSYHLDRDRDVRRLATENDEWEISDPKAIYTWWKNHFDDGLRDKGRRLVRYLKMWAALHFKDDARPSSILLTVLVAKALKSIDTGDFSGDDELLREIISLIITTLKKSSFVDNPINASENLNRLSEENFKNLKTWLEDLLSIADRALSANNIYESSDIWSEAFEHFFPLPEDTDSQSGMSSNAIPVLTNNPDIAATATVGNRQWKGFNEIKNIPKGCKIEFNIANPGAIPHGAKIHWTIRNEGAEAEAANDLGHGGAVGLRHHERSAYRGTHFVDVLVRLNGRTIGRRRIKVSISGLGIPPRNPKRPDWTKLR